MKFGIFKSAKPGKWFVHLFEGIRNNFLLRVWILNSGFVDKRMILKWFMFSNILIYYSLILYREIYKNWCKKTLFSAIVLIKWKLKNTIRINKHDNTSVPCYRNSFYFAETARVLSDHDCYKKVIWCEKNVTLVWHFNLRHL